MAHVVTLELEACALSGAQAVEYGFEVAKGVSEDDVARTFQVFALGDWNYTLLTLRKKN